MTGCGEAGMPGTGMDGVGVFGVLGIGCSLWREVTGVSESDLLGLLGGKISTEALRKALAEAKLAGLNLGLQPLTFVSADQVPSIPD
jgi:hypothetical protein